MQRLQRDISPRAIRVLSCPYGLAAKSHHMETTGQSALVVVNYGEETQVRILLGAAN